VTDAVTVMVFVGGGDEAVPHELHVGHSGIGDGSGGWAILSHDEGGD
jgi:hypothetical protein